MDLKSFVNTKAGPYREILDESRLSAFARSVSVSPSQDAPPTFMTVFRRGEFELLEKMGIPLSKVLHGEQEYTYENPIRAGDTIEFESQLSSVFEKKGGSGTMHFLVFDTQVRIQRQGKTLPAGISKTTIVMK